ncbi:hypothetical protein ABZ235_32385 [Streptomyces canus]|uniref:hypothetical protein n=1 Tax=Streptomyces canus TaxID=58343 RepID=UPI0033B805F4
MATTLPTVSMSVTRASFRAGMPMTRTAVWTPFMYAVWLPSTTAALSWAGIA